MELGVGMGCLGTTGTGCAVASSTSLATDSSGHTFVLMNSTMKMMIGTQIPMAVIRAFCVCSDTGMPMEMRMPAMAVTRVVKYPMIRAGSVFTRRRFYSDDPR